MNLLQKRRAAAKVAQLARLAAKGTPEYGALYAAQPSQIRKSIALKAQRRADSDKKYAAELQGLSDANDAIDIFGNMEVK